MDSAAEIRWCEEENTLPCLSVVTKIKGEAWGEEQISQVLKTLSPDKKVWVIDVRTEQTQ